MLRKTTQLIWVSMLSMTLFSLSANAAESKEVKASYNGLTVNANVVLAEGKTLKDEVVLFMHGTLTHNGREPYGAIQELLAENGISSVAPNLSFNIDDRHGEYDCATYHTHKHEDALKEIGFWLDWLKAEGAESVTLMAHSRGGNQTAWYSVENDSDMIKNVVLIAPQTWSKEGEYADYKKNHGADLAPLFKKANDLVKQGKGDTKMSKVNFIYCKDTDVSAESFVSYYADEPRMDTPSLLENAVKPTLVIIGSADNVVADLPAKMENVKNDNVSTYVVEDADHFFLDLFAEDLVENAVEFIRQ